MSLHASCIWIFAVALLAISSLAHADSVKLGGVWIRKVTDVKVADGRVFYTTPSGGEVDRPFESLQGVELDAYPDLAVISAALDAKKDADAIAPLERVRNAAKEPWLKYWAGAQEVAAEERLAKPIEAVEAYLQLARDGADSAYLSHPPLKALPAATPDQRADLLKRLTQAAGGTSGAAAAAIKKMTDLLSAAAPAPTPAAAVAPSTPPAADGKMAANPPAAMSANAVAPAPTPAPAPAPAAVTADGTPSAVPLPKVMEPDDFIAVMLEKGQFQPALDAAKKELATPSKPGELALRLYQQGIAQIYLGQAKNDQKLIKDAGLSFMRIITYFKSNSSSWVGPSEIELGLVHDLLGRPDIANKMWERAKIEVLDTEEPQLRARLEKLIADSAARNGGGKPEDKN